MMRLRLLPDGPCAHGYRSWCTEGLWVAGEVREVPDDVAEYLLAKDGAFARAFYDGGPVSPSELKPAEPAEQAEPDAVTLAGLSARDAAQQIRDGLHDDDLELFEDARKTVRNAIALRRRLLAGGSSWRS